MSSRHGRAKKRAELQFFAACEEIVERAEDAKAAYAEARTLETLAEKRAAMGAHDETPTWVLAVAAIKRAERDLVEYAGKADPKSVRKLETARADLERIPREFGALITAMEALSGTTVSGIPPADPLPDGAAEATPRPVRMRKNTPRPEGGS